MAKNEICILASWLGTPGARILCDQCEHQLEFMKPNKTLKPELRNVVEA